MSADSERLVALAAAIADGDAIDWGSLEAEARDGRERDAIVRLREVAELARAHLSFSSPSAVAVGPEPFEATPPPDRSDLWPGRLLGNRYRVDRFLGRGGMGEVWQTFDLKLGVEVALKSLRATPTASGRRELLRGEVRAARQVISPNVCRIYDLIEIEGREFVSMEYVDGVTLAERLRQQGPMTVPQASEVAVQLLAGLQAIHDAGLVHRDLKPANVMITPAGRVVLMDFGLAKAILEKHESGIIAGTPAYMPPEQLRGEPVDARGDVYAAALVLSELVRPDPLADPVSEHAPPVTGTRDDRTPAAALWGDALLRALSPDAADRYRSARAFARALEEVSLRSGREFEKNPFPGLSSFTEADADYFFGREADIESLGRKLKRLHMIALVGPSGVGKSSLLRAGLIPSLPSGWASVICTPGTSPFVTLGQALVPHLAGDPDALRALLRFQEPDVAVSLFRRWRHRQREAVLIVDQFEELFTQNPEEVQARFAELLARLPLEAEVRVVLSMRDDFLFHCHAHPGLRPILTELTLLPPLRGADLRRALVQPALACGFRFEDEALVDRIVGEVESERGALPLLAFTAARLWERRDRNRGILPRDAYEAIGGVAGSLAHHAEATLERIGADRQAIVREMFRGLVTAQGTRLSREREELLSVVNDREAASETLDELVTARLLTAFEVADPDDPGVRHQRVEFVHESLLSHWPRLVRWQTQDADGAQFRDQLRQAAQMWEDSGRPDDLLWTGSVYQEFRLWRERYPGGLTRLEEAFGSASIALAKRQARRRRIVVGSALSVLLAGLAIMAVLWWRSEKAEEKALAEARRAEAEKLYTLAQNDAEPSNVVAYSLAAVELSDQAAYRRLAVKAFLRAPLPIRLPVRPDSHNAWSIDISPDGGWMAIGWAMRGGLQLYSLEGGEARELTGHDNRVVRVRFSDDSRLLVSTARDGTARLWSVPDGRLLRTLQVAEVTLPFFDAKRGRVITCELIEDGRQRWKAWPLEGGEALELGWTGEPTRGDVEPALPDLDRSGTRVVASRDREVVVYALEHLNRGPVRVLGRHDKSVAEVLFAPVGDLVASVDRRSEVRLWSLSSASDRPLHVFRVDSEPIGASFNRSGDRLFLGTKNGGRVWDLRSPGTAPLVLDVGSWTFNGAFSPDQRWLVTTGIDRRLDAWPLALSRPIGLVGAGTTMAGLVFAPDGSWIAGAARTGDIELWPLRDRRVSAPRILFHENEFGFGNLSTDREGRYLVASVYQSARGEGTLVQVSVASGEPKTWTGANPFMYVDASGRWISATPTRDTAGAMRLWDTRSGVMTEIGSAMDTPVGFTHDERLLTCSRGDLLSWDLTLRDHRLIAKGLCGAVSETKLNPLAHRVKLCPDRETLLLHDDDGAISLRRLDGGEIQQSPVRVDRAGLMSWAADSSCDLVVFGRQNGDVDVVRTSRGEVHHVPIHDGATFAVAIDPLGRWIASASDDGAKLWEIPSGPALLDRPREDFLRKMTSCTNRVAVRDDRQPTGYAIEGSSIPDWRHPPTW